VRRRRPSPGWLLLAWLALAGCPEPPEPATLRLLDRVDRAEIEWPRGAGRQRPRKAFLRAAGLPAQDARYVGRFIGRWADGAYDNRAAIGAPPGSVYRFDLELPKRAVLRVALGVAPAHRREAAQEAKGAEGSARFLIRIEPAAGQPEVVLDEVVERDVDEPWVEREVDLAAWAGRPVTLTLEIAASAKRSAAGWAAWGAPEVVVKGAREPGWDLLLISLDTLRADRLGSYGYPRPTSPHLDALAGEAIRFETAIAAAPWTHPSHHAMFTGIYPLSTGGLGGRRLAEVLRDVGYRTTAFTGGGQLDYRFGFARGFDEYRLVDWLHAPESVVAWFERERERRRFVFLHTYEIHDPYVHGELAEGMPRGRLGDRFGKREWLIAKGRLSEEEQRYVGALYDGGIAFTDRKLGELLAALRSKGLLERTVVVVTSDHGEQFFEHGSWRHGMNLYDEQVRVPLIVQLPAALARELGVEGSGRVIGEQVSLVDLLPTLLEMLGVERGWPVNGRSLLPLLRGESDESLDARQAFSENTNINTMERKALRTRRYKYVHSYPKARGAAEGLEETFELYDLMRDPGERVNRVEELESVASAFEELLTAIRGAELALDDEELDAEDLDPDLRRRLEALGYLGGN
jgi:arylsulfatase A-like enzyme